ncbi:helix-turn-helix transcriptional regulator [Lutibacter sp.]|uniref:helix-turn-helix domain-containing protein n=1 Tax=Lutibacter sp. TaxID=1925666 RepID=UPI002732626C|nr:helix-turn-helix transcriptional regulator [Lutibacter sp.]MDP3313251.1 helix-turn-helix transcriptional regulator [Lutibacter sp.]
MTVQDGFSIKLNKIIDYYQLTAATFADKIGVPRSSISHILSGRNKPSLDFVLKIMNEFPEVDFNWLILDKGAFPVIKSNKNYSSTLFTENEMKGYSENEDLTTNSLKSVASSSLKSDTNGNSLKMDENQPTTIEEIERIVIFYTNGTFKNYRP